MKLSIKSKDLELTKPIKAYIIEKINDLSDIIKPFEKDGEVFISFEIARITKHHKQGGIFYAEANVDLLGEKIRIEQTEENVRAAIDKLKDVLKRKIRDVKEKNIDQKREAKRPCKPKK
jgi:putative sigma-54 modulation protein